MSNKINLRTGVLILFVLIAAFSRLIPHPPNFTPIGGMALFGAAYFSKRYLGFLVPLAAMWLSDLVYNNLICRSSFLNIIPDLVYLEASGFTVPSHWLSSWVSTF